MNIDILFPPDKRLHYIGGNVAAIAAAMIGPRLGLEPSTAAMLGSSAAGIGKELLDLAINWYTGEARHTAEPADVFATVAGGVPIALLTM